MESEEISAIIVAGVVLSLAFTIAFQNGIFGVLSLSPSQLIGTFILSLIIVFTSFVLHEMGHRQVARKFGAYAEFRKWNLGLVLAIVTSFFGFIFAAPGAVMIHARSDLWGRTAAITRKKMGIISLTGPGINIILAIAFFGLQFVLPISFSYNILPLGVAINAWLALFNLLPVPPLDGSKVFAWNKIIWAAAIAISAAFVYFAGF